jgi:hypothetical protein
VSSKEFAKFQETISDDVNNAGKIKVDELLREQGEEKEEEDIDDDFYLSEEKEKTEKILELKKKAAEVCFPLVVLLFLCSYFAF